MEETKSPPPPFFVSHYVFPVNEFAASTGIDESTISTSVAQKVKPDPAAYLAPLGDHLDLLGPYLQPYGLTDPTTYASFLETMAGVEYEEGKHTHHLRQGGDCHGSEQ